MSDVSPLADAAIDDWVAHWDDYAEAAEHNPASAYRRRIIVRELARLGVGRDTRVLDIGSGQGDLVRDVTQKWPTASVLGVELSPVGTSPGTTSERVEAAVRTQRP